MKFTAGLFVWQMVSAEDGGERSAMVIDPEGLAEIVEQSRILEASHVREVSMNRTLANVLKHLLASCYTLNRW